ncbi:hypothetical protein DERP_013763 [Dermatophagoides pteronyssinus]|uniref:Uncharacterized protein n=1 Tax=Dermatophagoides pteronyssinus TaxID=6956 RepID=A0ABQ8JFE0_DERPT|nr:hypothetical protein DERP_013763 [Dermatophagoides pteronyssinus]
MLKNKANLENGLKKFFISSSSSKPNKNEKLTTKEIVPSKDLRRIPSTTSTNADHLDKPIEMSEWSPQIPKKINIQHVGADLNDFNIFPNEPIDPLPTNRAKNS